MVAQLETFNLDSATRLPYQIEGLIQVFTSSQRHFFTSVIAQSVRIAAQGTPVLVVQFLKGGVGQGHERPVCLGQNLDWLRCDLPRCINTPHLDESEVHALHQLWECTQDMVLEGKYSLVVLDELSLAIHFGLIAQDEVLSFLKKRPTHMDLIFTGAEMPDAICDIANQVTEIRYSHQP
ncbi:MAG: cob(I)yrinic acid a c-diamide adenosyltransferase [Cyanobacteria bacterium QH_8_48_120]|jgi:cob(I)alamin adenosyltransferase|nr:MAG: cob(I)yrinic acid a c-diamide adenosyltransferase [Cyanobacteria bacterium QH_2_48_84]PSO61863.1 MAG: cob(I)yrinic acid a c-diamide adenosyltransferase [Cyanobacteria bacterium QH_6_48_35]PSO67287.1 MAG: cob(I)yrinic acid a c-diamide adenosyltransferase [Cyanobacteria bacterium QH_7_48_89]PSO71470.1 MAG: cob(I)yrinic acid a c-diamide adenosyltransferase [Cyanobacteria bacterium QS_1_48_34]PSO72076.1 MAG: cob(I)yrinic acid a c-diamide adenosyltransferase [Cyanobacteria bacterium QH_3_48_